MKISDVDFFEKLQSQMYKLHSEMSVLAKGKPDNPINKFKLRIVNEKLQAANTILTDTFKPIAEFELFDEAELPTNSDVVIVLSQYLQSLESWRSTHTYFDETDYKWHWKVDGAKSAITDAPTILKSN